MSSMSRIIEEKITTLVVDLSSSFANIKDECLAKIDTGKSKSSSPTNVDIDVRKNDCDINLL